MRPSEIAGEEAAREAGGVLRPPFQSYWGLSVLRTLEIFGSILTDRRHVTEIYLKFFDLRQERRRSLGVILRGQFASMARERGFGSVRVVTPAGTQITRS